MVKKWIQKKEKVCTEIRSLINRAPVFGYIERKRRRDKERAREYKI